MRTLVERPRAQNHLIDTTRDCVFEHAVQKGSSNSATLMAREHTDLNNLKDAPRLVKDVRSAVMESGQNITDCRSILFGQPTGLVWSVDPRPKHFDDSCMFSRPKDIWKSGDMNVLNDAAQRRQLVYICESRTSNGERVAIHLSQDLRGGYRPIP